MQYKFEEIAEIVKGTILCQHNALDIFNVIYDTRKTSYEKNSIFFAFKGALNDGHEFLEEAYDLGIRNFVVSKKINKQSFPEANILRVHSCLMALQKLAAHHRQKFDIPIIGITGSNGKTIVKEWLDKCLSQKYKVVKSPKSYNSQIGVALSLLQIDESHEIAVIEAGISSKNEMRFLAKMIKPTLGIFTNIGDAHSSGFDSKEQKLLEKLELFETAKNLIVCLDQVDLFSNMPSQLKSIAISWSEKHQADFKLVKEKGPTRETILKISHQNRIYSFETDFHSREFIENLMHVVCCLIHLGFDQDEIQSSISNLDSIENRLEIREGINDNLLINDSYSLDLASLQLALEFQDFHGKGLQKILVISDFEQQLDKHQIYSELNILLQDREFRKIYAIAIHQEYRGILKGLNIQFFEDLNDFLNNSSYYTIANSCILIKGARRYRLESIFQKLSKQVHQTVLETHLSALDHNINVYRSYLKDDTQLMAVIKAEAYGSGSAQLAGYLENKNIDYLSVAIIDEGISIRESNCKMPIMVFNVQQDQLEKLWDYQLEPEIYSLELLDMMIEHAEKKRAPLSVHLMIDTGMHRLGFSIEDLNDVCTKLKAKKWLKVKSLMSHLASSENEEHDAFTKSQIQIFEESCHKIETTLNYAPMRHICNTAGIIRFNQHQMQMVRLGLGLYGIDETGIIADKLQKVHSLKARILQIKTLQAGESTGYGLSGKVDKTTTIATVSIGYADGILRACGNGNYKMRIGKNHYPTIGNICMDLCMLDITGADNLQAGDTVVIFDEDTPIESLAQACNTISYEIISRISPRVKRSYTYR
jgi:alanine racemase